MRSNKTRALMLLGLSLLTIMSWWTFLVNSGEWRFEAHWALLHIAFFVFITLAGGIHYRAKRKRVSTLPRFIDWMINAWGVAWCLAWLTAFSWARYSG
ncbi:MAG: hypothetical protein OXQ86_08895 [Gammaproteobacteria bacterium]|nr:hypothetical protein [Gammaproteobacteria bacterium]MDE0414024.1 hypothetical protein [Gammaproteobacteria bacterium]